MPTFISFIGSTLAVVASTTTDMDPSDLAALTWTGAVGNVQSIGPINDTAEDISFATMSDGRMNHVNGTKDIGDVEVTIAYERADAGLTILEAGNNSNTKHTFRIVDSDGDTYYYEGLIAGLGVVQRDSSTHKHLTFIMRVTSAEVKVDGT